MTRFYEKSFSWKAGRYEGHFKPAFLRKVGYLDEAFTFELKQTEVDLMRRNSI